MLIVNEQYLVLRDEVELTKVFYLPNLLKVQLDLDDVDKTPEQIEKQILDTLSQIRDSLI